MENFKVDLLIEFLEKAIVVTNKYIESEEMSKYRSSDLINQWKGENISTERVLSLIKQIKGEKK